MNKRRRKLRMQCAPEHRPSAGGLWRIVMPSPMPSRVEPGFLVVKVPLRCRYEKLAGQGKVLVRDEPHTPLSSWKLSTLCHRRFEPQADVARFLLAAPGFPRDAKGQISWSTGRRGTRESIRRATIEDQFGELMKQLRPCEGIREGRQTGVCRTRGLLACRGVWTPHSSYH
jgi:hypothetical protein